MPSSFFVVVLMFLATTSLHHVHCWPDSKVTSREYKTMLNASLFVLPTATNSSTTHHNNNNRAGNNPFRRIPTHVDQMLSKLETDLQVAAAASGAVLVQGSLALKDGTPRTVQFYDTPGHCHLRRNAWILRTRTAVDAILGDDDTVVQETEATLKSRSGDRYHTTYRKKTMNECHPDHARPGKHKLEEDIARLDFTGNAYSFSQKCHVSKDYSFGTLHDMTRIWYEMHDVLAEEPYQWNVRDMDLAVVSNVTVVEWKFEGFHILLSEDNDTDDDDDDNLKKRTAKVSVTLWYHHHQDDDNAQQPYPSTPPIVAELSFVIKADNEDWSQDTVMTAHNLWSEQYSSQLSPWLDASSSTKTAWVYAHDKFCAPPDDLVSN